MTPYFSLYLDAVRFFAAMVVVLSHFAYPRFTGGEYIVIRELNLGSDAVVLFFVLSGLVISYTADVKDRALRAFAWSRLTRLYSVALPAVLMTILLDRLGQGINPEAYDGWWYNPAPAALQILQGLTFTNEWGFTGLRLGSNGPYWSLSYEFAYYLMFAAAVFMKGGRRAGALLLLVILAGPAVLFLFPVWLIGVWLYKRIKAGVILEAPAALTLVIVPAAFYALLLAAGLPPLLLAGTKGALGAGVVNGLLRFSDEFIWNGLTGILAAIHMLGVAALCRARTDKPEGRVARFIRWGAGASFSLYLVHYPAFQFADAVLPEAMAGRDGILLASVLAFCFLFAALTERRLPRLRARLAAMPFFQPKIAPS